MAPIIPPFRTPRRPLQPIPLLFGTNQNQVVGADGASNGQITPCQQNKISKKSPISVRSDGISQGSKITAAARGFTGSTPGSMRPQSSSSTLFPSVPVAGPSSSALPSQKLSHPTASKTLKNSGLPQPPSLRSLNRSATTMSLQSQALMNPPKHMLSRPFNSRLPLASKMKEPTREGKRFIPLVDTEDEEDSDE
ncbi:hypothetical protein FA15DRAFT_338687 [Coprinopsis marcescibilis]|uniref:Uncharacterized protein n=1 Tax=Coprinopsis marcescibilis TaxID=230819 RepID=A0A5C3KZ47_COPMA|nr:hypothetical protein FA15DRAFT_338687 [Coprinopsis marcescibilis]